MDARINVQIKNQFGETEDETTIYAKTYAAAARKAMTWLGKMQVKIEKRRVGNYSAWWIVHAKGVTPCRPKP